MKEIVQLIKNTLNEFYPATEIDSFIKILLRDVLKVSLIDLYLDKDIKFTPNQIEQLQEVLERLKQYEPIQYIVGYTEFYGMNLTLTKDVLIPRPETEELVDLICKENKNLSGKVLDIGTGSGCIALSIAYHLPDSIVEGWDISERALRTAHKNSNRLKIQTSFEKIDILSYQPLEQFAYDLIVSNPPYVIESEKQDMEPNVLNWEPYTALFVPDDKPLLFYEAISQKGYEMLVTGGKIYFEINPLFAAKLCDMMSDIGFYDIKIYKDLAGRERFVRGIK